MTVLRKCKTILFLMSFAISLLMTGSMAFALETDAADRENVMVQDQLRNKEIGNVKKAVDDALIKADYDEVEIRTGDILEGAAKGMPLENLEGVPKAILVILGKELRANVHLILELIAVMILAAIIKGLQPNESILSNQAARFAINCVLAVIAAASFGSITQVARGAVESMQTMASIAMPALMALMASTGKIVSVTAFQPIMLAGVNVASHVFKTVLMPLAVMAGVLFLVDSLSSRFKLKTLAKLVKSFAVWGTAALTLVFSVAVSIQKFSSTPVDAIAVKTAKFAIGTFVPVAGKNMSDAAEILLACAGAARNAAGVLTIIGLCLLCAIPFIKVFIIMITYRLAAALGTPLCDSGISDSLEDAAGCMSVMLGIMGASLFTMIILAGSLMSMGGYLS